jgi:hypothetical protein
MQRHMNPNKIIVLVFASVFLANSAWCEDKEGPTSPEALISRARSQEEIWTDGTPPMSMRAELQIFDSKGAPVHGDYSLIGWRLLNGENKFDLENMSGSAYETQKDIGRRVDLATSRRSFFKWIRCCT